MRRLSVLFILIVIVFSCVFSFVGCNKESSIIRFVAPEGTPALAMLKLASDNQCIASTDINYEVVSPSNIAAEMSSQKADIVIMPVNAGANLIRQGADYKLVSIAVDGSLYMVGNKETSGEITFEDIKGKRIACIGQTGVPGLVFRYILTKNNISIVTEGVAGNNEVFVQYVADGPAAKQLLANKSVDFAVVGEPAASQFKKALNLNAEMDLQKAYKNADASNGDTYPQAGLFVRTSLCTNTEFMNDLFAKLVSSKEWIESNPNLVQDEAKKVYESAVFPSIAINRCAINSERLTNEAQEKIIVFLKNIMPKDSNKNVIDWDNEKGKIF